MPHEPQRDETSVVSPFASATIRMFDIAFALGLLILLSPVLLVTGLFVWMVDGLPVVFRQTRSGRRQAPFIILKFRTLTVTKEGAQKPTRMGTWLRRTNLDELPQLANILFGDMSFVGPRPLLPEYDPYYRKTELKRFFVRPGLTGLAQISGRNAMRWDDKLEADVRFVESYSVRSYIRILALTVARLASGKAKAEQWNYETRLDEERRDEERRSL